MRTEMQTSPIRLVPMCALLSLLLLWAAESTGLFALLFLLPIALVLLPLAAERMWGWLLLIIVLTAGVVLVLPVPHYVWLAYIGMLAPYVPLRHALRHLKLSRTATLLSVGIVSLWMFVVSALLILFGWIAVDWLTGFYAILIGFACVVFLFITDACYQLYLKFYETHLKRFLLPCA